MTPLSCASIRQAHVTIFLMGANFACAGAVDAQCVKQYGRVRHVSKMHLDSFHDNSVSPATRLWNGRRVRLM
ncbi:hypothetical protein METBIDRAFT_104270 [Metschnikowia bicuspidata var. bicuspidata NRRL YB-4993]|uniref:Secreted protein n=1 Tax=Metschnikowia bicuspidata var. bicuspidata NRRL YB-4993 TaxID=869754 RepID=A0A1A0HHL2_9ASCO|nr:hypothetical protein METBIDRAFT_104270 [Metschnikowia bicuspidata var. bicuspidata NRRL YB-4993]OBA23333.1 hypothetical protein METBIDRAFT_104270 [Metschnikowia bicuspidata var. bicuspidata NRRL YB-4993]